MHGCLFWEVASCVHCLGSFRSPVLIFTSHGRLMLSVSCQNVKVLCSEGKQGLFLDGEVGQKASNRK